MPYPLIRIATEVDYEAIWRIWMQDHVIRWMSFLPQGKEQFQEKLKQLETQSDIYVLVDSIDQKECVVGVRRIKYLKAPYSHVAEFCSMGVDSQYQGRGYGKLFYDLFEAEVKRKGIKRVQITQSGGNEVAMHIGQKMGYREEALFPDWLQRKGSKGYPYYVNEKFIYKLLDEEIGNHTQKARLFENKMPNLLYTEPLELDLVQENNTLKIFAKNKPLLEVGYYPDNSVIRHIAFITPITLLDSQVTNKDKVAALRFILQCIMKSNPIKKIELITNDAVSIELCEQLGFWKRGERIASFKKDDVYCNELALEYSFFTIDDAKALLLSIGVENDYQDTIKELNASKDVITEMLDSKLIDALGANYLENISYQIVRDEIGKTKLFSLAEKNWEAIIPLMPEALASQYERLKASIAKNQTIQNRLFCLPKANQEIPNLAQTDENKI